MKLTDLNTDLLRVVNPVRLAEVPTLIELDDKQNAVKEAIKRAGKELSRIQERLYAHNRYGVLVCLQGMDTAGKDSLIREVFSRFNPRGVVVHSFKAPNSEELQYDYLWRHYRALPDKGKFAIFNRSHYENVLVTRVNPQLILKENIPGISKVVDIPPDFWEKRMEQIRHFEKHLVQNGIILFKFFLHLGKCEQAKRLLRRLEKKRHTWKFTPSDITEREHWEHYQECYQEAINQTSTPEAPWHIIPADSKPLARYMVASIILERMLEYIDIREPEPNSEVMENIEMYKALLLKGC